MGNVSSITETSPMFLSRALGSIRDSKEQGDHPRRFPGATLLQLPGETIWTFIPPLNTVTTTTINMCNIVTRRVYCGCCGADMGARSERVSCEYFRHRGVDTDGRCKMGETYRSFQSTSTCGSCQRELEERARAARLRERYGGSLHHFIWYHGNEY